MRNKRMENIPQQNIKKKFYYFSYLIFGGIFFLFLALIFTFILSKNKSRNQPLTINQPKNISSSPTPSPIPSSKKFFKLKLATSKKIFSLNDQINVEVYADSEGKNISGFDLLISYNPQELEFVNASSESNDFSLYSFKKENYITLTGTKKINSDRPTVFSSTKIANLIFKPKKLGRYQISLLENYRKEKTQMVDDQTNVYSPSLNQLEIEIR